MYSTETALIKLVDELLFGLDNNHVCGMVLVDYRKAFDMVDHKLLLRKLELYGIVYLLNSDFSFIIALFALLCLTLTLFGQIAIKSRFIGS